MRSTTEGPAGLRAPSAHPEAAVLCVDLDGTLIRADTLHESVLALLKTHPLALFHAIIVLFRRGIAAFKRSVASHVVPAPELLPYNQDLVHYLRDEAARGRRILLVTAADSRVAAAVAGRLGIFETFLASDGRSNLKGPAKAARIRDYLQGQPFDYIGDSQSDVPVWKDASAALVVNPSHATLRALHRAGVSVAGEFTAPAPAGALVRALRLYQWSKNLLVFVPLFLSHRVFDPDKLLLSIRAFAAFCAAASAIYVVNDLLDLDSDRRHPRKRHRPFAAGDATALEGVILAASLLALSLLLSIGLPLLATGLVALYIAASLFYNLYAKTRLFLDVAMLAGLYTVRLLCGGVATDIVISPWTLGFSIFFFTSLASCKRLSELRAGKPEQPADPLPGRAYFQSDLLSLTGIASSSAYAAVLVMALYLNSPDFMKLYERPWLMWSLVPLVSYWISRAIMIANRGSMHEDPIVFAFGDRASQVVGLIALAVILASL
jgi:4-hydroxybenzoate polyprenyltransferase/phosphoserine phosphatase